MTVEFLVCPGCRTRSPGRIDVRTLERSGDVLVCECGRRYPIIDGVPIVIANPASYFEREIAGVVERDLSPEVGALLAQDGPDDAPYAQLLHHLSGHLDAHWGDRAEPPLDHTGTSGLIDRIAARAHDRVGLAVDLGCSAGRIAAELAAGADRVVGIDLHFATLRRARRLLDGERLAYARRMVGRQYATVHAAAGDRAVPANRRSLVCGDVLDPPLVHGQYDRVVALNMIDSVRQPRQLLSVIDGLCAERGEIIVSSPYAWQSSVMEEHERFGGADPAAELVAILREGRDLGAAYQIEDEAQISWTLRMDARSAVAYTVHYVRARKM